MTLTELAAGLGMTTQGAAKIVAAMTAGGYVCSTPDPADGRAKRLALDERGRRALRRARALHASYERRLVRRLGDRRAADLRQALTLVGESGEVDAASPRAAADVSRDRFRRGAPRGRRQASRSSNSRREGPSGSSSGVGWAAT